MPHVAPLISTPSRLPGLDLARAVATYLMMIINFKLIFHHNQGYFPWLTGLAERLDGRAAALFVVLAGIGVSCLAKKMGVAAPSRGSWQTLSLLFKRAIVFLFAGALLSLTWPCDILHVYAVFLIAGALAVPLTQRQVLALFVLLWPLFLGVMSLSDYDLLWQNAGLPLYKMKTLPAIANHYLFSGTYPMIPWLIFFLAGLCLGRQSFQNPRKRNQLIFFGLLTAAAAEAASFFLLKFNAASYFSYSLEQVTIINDTVSKPVLHWFIVRAFPPTPLFVVSALGTAMFIIGSAQYAVERWPSAKAIQLLVSTGRLSLTAYVGHILFGINALECFGVDGNQHILFVFEWATLTFLVFVLLACYLEKHSRKGPLEWVIRQTSAKWFFAFRIRSNPKHPLEHVS